MNEVEKNQFLTLLQWVTPIIMLALCAYFVSLSIDKDKFDELKTLVFVGTIFSAISFYLDLPKEPTRNNTKQTTKACFGMAGMFMLSFAAMFSL